MFKKSARCEENRDVAASRVITAVMLLTAEEKIHDGGVQVSPQDTIMPRAPT